jgi:GT2 family glycosyltransferase
MTTVPRVRVLVVNFDGGDMTMRCLRALRCVDWPREALEIVMVDNGSIDGLAPRVRRELPDVRVIEHTHNVGFAGGCNLGLRDLDDVDYVALLNNDAIPDRNWLRPLVEALESDPGLGAANSKIVFAPAFVALEIESPTFQPPGDDRDLGVRVCGLEVDDEDVWPDVQFGHGCHAPETGRAGTAGFCWTAATAELRVPVPHDGPLPTKVAVELAAEVPKTVRVRCGGDPVDSVEVEVGPTPRWISVPMGGEPFDVVNNVGSRLVEGGYGGDRGFLERDVGQYERREEIFAWCGAAVLLSVRYLRDVGIFDDRYFVYYEDTDLSWRGRLAGWRYLYVPESKVRHEHAATSKEGSTLFHHYVERNRFLTLARNAPWPMVARAIKTFVVDTLAIFKRDVIMRIAARRGPDLRLVMMRARAFLAFLKLLPPTLVSRIRQHPPRGTRRRLVETWAVPQ